MGSTGQGAALTHGQIAMALRLAWQDSGAVHAGEAASGDAERAEGAAASARPEPRLARAGACVTAAVVMSGALVASGITDFGVNSAANGTRMPSAEGAGGSIPRTGTAADAHQGTETRQERTTMFDKLTGVAAATAVGLSAAANGQGVAVQWRVQDGGNGHWYQRIEAGTFVTWNEARSGAESRGGYLTCPTTASENEWIWSTLIQPASSGWDGWIGLHQLEGPEPFGGWKWVSGEPTTFTSWCGNQPDDSNGLEDYGHYMTIHGPGCWNDIRQDGSYSGVHYIRDFFVEWSADCNGDGIVDYGQILDGALPDSNTNGVPDCCESGGSCCLGDILADRVINGADLGAVLFYWGPVTTAPTSRACDLNDDNVVNGVDLGILLAAWGPCAG